MRYRWHRSIRRMIFSVMVALVPWTFWTGAPILRQGSEQAWFGTGPSALLGTGLAEAQELVFIKALDEADKAIREARDFEAEVYAPEEFSLALNYLTQAKDEAKVFRAASQTKPEPHLFSARKSGETVSLLAERAQYQAKVAGAKAVEVKSNREIIAIKAQIADTFNTDVNRRFTSRREELFGALGTKEAVRSEARRARTQAESELRKLGLEVQAAPTAR